MIEVKAPNEVTPEGTKVLGKLTELIFNIVSTHSQYYIYIYPHEIV